MGDGRAQGSSAGEDRGQAAVSLTPDGSGSLLDSALSTLSRKDPVMSVWELFSPHHG